MKRLTTISLFLLCNGFVMGQFGNLKWIKSSYILDFTKTPAEYISINHPFIGDDKSFALTDCVGNFKFVASQRGHFLNGNLDTIPGGRSLGGGRNPHAGMLDGIVYPGSTDSIIVFHSTGKFSNLGFGWSLIDLSANGGTGQVRNFAEPIGGYTSANLTIVRHSNNKDYWILSTPDSITLYAHLLTKRGLSTTPVISQGHFFSPTYFSVKFQVPSSIVSSRDGKSLVAKGLRKSYHNSAAVVIYDFDRTSGKLSNEKPLLLRSALITPEHVVSKATFSPNDSFIYFGTSISFFFISIAEWFVGYASI